MDEYSQIASTNHHEECRSHLVVGKLDACQIYLRLAMPPGWVTLKPCTATQVLELVTGFLPPWYTDSEVERVDWLNKMLNKVCTAGLLYGSTSSNL